MHQRHLDADRSPCQRVSVGSCSLQCAGANLCVMEPGLKGATLLSVSFSGHMSKPDVFAQGRVQAHVCKFVMMRVRPCQALKSPSPVKGSLRFERRTGESSNTVCTLLHQLSALQSVDFGSAHLGTLWLYMLSARETNTAPPEGLRL